MPDGFTDADIELLADLERAATSVGVTPFLIGAGAIQLAPTLGWEVRLSRRTKDWDFAVRVDSWERFHGLAAALTETDGGFERAREPHRFRHRAGGQLDVIPYGGIEDPRGRLRWPSGSEMNTAGFEVLDEHHEGAAIGRARLRVATLPVLVGLKLLSYADRRPGVIRDIRDAVEILRDAEERVSDKRIESEALKRLQSGDFDFGEAGSYLVGRDVARIFGLEERDRMSELLREAECDRPRIVTDAARADGLGHDQERVRRCLAAFRLGLIDH